MKKLIIVPCVAAILFIIGCGPGEYYGSYPIPAYHSSILNHLPDTQTFISSDSNLYTFVYVNQFTRIKTGSDDIAEHGSYWEYEYITHYYICDSIGLEYSVTWYGSAFMGYMYPLYVFEFKYPDNESFKFRYFIEAYTDTAAFSSASSLECLNRELDTINDQWVIKGILHFNTSEGILDFEQQGVAQLYRTNTSSEK